MAEELLLIREGTKLGAADPISAEIIDGLRQGEMVTATIRRPRNPRHHRLAMALLTEVYKNQERFATFNQLLTRVKIETGYYELETLPGKVPMPVLKPKSISFAAMGQTEFAQFWDKALAYILTDVLPGLDKADLEQRVLEIAGGR